MSTEPQPTDGPDYHADRRAWLRQRARGLNISTNHPDGGEPLTLDILRHTHVTATPGESGALFPEEAMSKSCSVALEVVGERPWSRLPRERMTDDIAGQVHDGSYFRMRRGLGGGGRG